MVRHRPTPNKGASKKLKGTPAGAPPTLDRIRRLAAVWNWLPAFRVVAELEHLPSAAHHLKTSPSALSRAVRLLEEAAGHQLFWREGRRLVLSPEGAVLLAGLRDSMRLLDDAFSELEGGLKGRFCPTPDPVQANGVVADGRGTSGNPLTVCIDCHSHAPNDFVFTQVH